MTKPTDPAPTTCDVCGKPAHYQSYGNRGSWWVHSDTYKFMSEEPRLHDVNTSMRTR